METRTMNVGLVGELLFIAAVIIIVCTALTPLFLKMAGAFFRSLLWHKTHYARPQPVLGPAKALRAQNNLIDAMAYLENIISSYPDLAVGFIELMDIYATDLKDKEMTTNTYHRGKSTVKGADEQRKLDEAYEFFMTD